MGFKTELKEQIEAAIVKAGNLNTFVKSCGVQYATIARYLSGERGLSFDTICKILDYLDYSIESGFGEKEQPSQSVSDLATDVPTQTYIKGKITHAANNNTGGYEEIAEFCNVDYQKLVSYLAGDDNKIDFASLCRIMNYIDDSYPNYLHMEKTPQFHDKLKTLQSENEMLKRDLEDSREFTKELLRNNTALNEGNRDLTKELLELYKKNQ